MTHLWKPSASPDSCYLSTYCSWPTEQRGQCVHWCHRKPAPCLCFYMCVCVCACVRVRPRQLLSTQLFTRLLRNPLKTLTVFVDFERPDESLKNYTSPFALFQVLINAVCTLLFSITFVFLRVPDEKVSGSTTSFWLSVAFPVFFILLESCSFRLVLSFHSE